MAIEKFIREKLDSARHPGGHSKRQRLDSSIAKIRDFLQGEPVVGGFDPDTQPQPVVPYMPEGEGTEIELFVAPGSLSEARRDLREITTRPTYQVYDVHMASRSNEGKR